MNKTKILSNLSKALHKNPLSKQKATYTDIILPVEKNQILEYKRLQEFNKAEVFDVKEKEIPQTLQNIFQKEGITHTLLGASLQDLELPIKSTIYNQPMEQLKDELFEIECGILQADYGVANLGVIALTSSTMQPRLLSLITKHCIVLLKKENILNNLSQVFQEVKKTHPQTLPSNILIIAGPSRTADIELQVVFGVHGPQKVYVILY